ncbi:MAG TPA: DUF2178 domain-containing protein [Candidatus Methanoperedens sp.]
MGKENIIRLILAPIFIVISIYSVLYGDVFIGEIMAAVGIAMFMNYIIRKLIYKNEVKVDEMIKRISGKSSDFAFLTTIISMALLSIMLHYYPMLIDAKGVLLFLMVVILVSKIACQLYYTRIKKEIDF